MLDTFARSFARSNQKPKVSHAYGMQPRWLGNLGLHSSTNGPQ